MLKWKAYLSFHSSEGRVVELAGVAELVYAQRSERCPLKEGGGSSPLACTTSNVVSSRVRRDTRVMNKIIRSVCYFAEKPKEAILDRAKKISSTLLEKGFDVQTVRICSPDIERILEFDAQFTTESCIFGVGTVAKEKVDDVLERFLSARPKDTSFNIDLTTSAITPTDVEILFTLIEKNPLQTFNFGFVFNNPPSSPFFPSSTYARNGFSIGLQATNLAEGCQSLEEWLARMKQTWTELHDMFAEDSEFLGIDSSIASLFGGSGSLVEFINRLGLNFSESATTDTYIKITNFIGSENPRPVGLCGIMFPCLEDFALAKEYERGEFPIERNIYLSLHSGLGVDTYPVGIDENPQRVVEILKLIQGLSNKYKKALSVRLISDGRAKIGQQTNFQNPLLKDVTVRKL